MILVKLSSLALSFISFFFHC